MANTTNNITMEIIENATYHYKNIRFSGKPSDEARESLKANGWRYNPHDNAWYPSTAEAKKNSETFVKEYQEKFFPAKNSGLEQKELTEKLEEMKVQTENYEEQTKNWEEQIVYLEAIIEDLRTQLSAQKSRIAELENELSTNSMTVSDEDYDEAEYTEKSTPLEKTEYTIGAEQFKKMQEIAELAAIDEKPKAEKQILNDAEKQENEDLIITKNELELVKSVLPVTQYVASLQNAEGEEKEFYIKKLKEIAKTVENAPKLYETDGAEQHAIVLRYFHPTGSETLVTEIGEKGEAFGFQCINGDWEMAEWGYIDLNELKNIRGMEVDYYLEKGIFYLWRKFL